MKNEGHARIRINQLLSEAGWLFFDSDKGAANILLDNVSDNCTSGCLRQQKGLAINAY